MTAGWVAAGVRGRALAGRRIGPVAAEVLAASKSLVDAEAGLARTPYAREVREGMDLPTAQRGVAATVLWHLRILAGWCPPLGATPVRMLAAGFEISNIVGHLARLGGEAAPAPFALGSLALAWPTVAETRSSSEARAALARSVWGDPGCEDLAGIRTALQLTWAERVAAGVPAAADWARRAAVLILARFRDGGGTGQPGVVAGRAGARVLGVRGAEAVARLADLPSEEVRWWLDVERSSARLVRHPRADSHTAVGVVGLLAADAWRTRAALALAAAGGGDLRQMLGFGEYSGAVA